jgi:dienelactone hydrolase
MSRRGRPRAAAVVALLAVALVSGACSSSSETKAPATTSTTVPTAEPVYADLGPFPVGYTTLSLPDREVAVFYPADRGAVAGKPKATYDQVAPLPDNLKGILPDEYNTVVTMPAYADVRASGDGPFPVVLFSHGAGSYNIVTSGLLAGVASWGFVVVSTDFFEYGLAAQVMRRQYPRDPVKARRVMLASLDLVGRESTRAGSRLERTVDASRVATMGHSAGGGTAFNALTDTRVRAAVGWATVPPAGEPAGKPTMIIGAGNDIAVTPAELEELYANLPAPKRLVLVGGTRAGHNTFTDICDVIRGGGGLVEFARENKLVTEQLLRLATNGCAKTDIEPGRFQRVVQHFTVAALREALRVDQQPVGLGDGITRAFGAIPVTYRHEP